VVPLRRLRLRLVAPSAVCGSLERYSRAIWSQQHIRSLHHNEHVLTPEGLINRWIPCTHVGPYA
jgi:hypothetical protein